MKELEIPDITEEIMDDENSEDEAVDVVEKPKKKKSRKPKEPEPPMTKEDVYFIKDNIPTMSYQDMADQRKLTKNQVTRIRTKLVKAIRDHEDVKDNDAMKALAEDYIKEYFSRPEEAKVGGKKGSKNTEYAQNIVEEILKGR